MNKEQAESELGQLLTRLSVAWHAHSTESFVGCFAPDATYISSAGQAMQGHAAIGRYFQSWHHGPAGPAPQIVPEVVEVMFPMPGLATVALSLKALRMATQTKHAASLVAVRSENGEWRIVHYHAAVLAPDPIRLRGKALDWLRRW